MVEDKNFEDEDLKDIQDKDKAAHGSQDKDKAAHGSSDNADNYEKICYMCRRRRARRTDDNYARWHVLCQ